MTTPLSETLSLRFLLLGVCLKDLCKKDLRTPSSEYDLKSYNQDLNYDKTTAQVLREINDQDFAQTILASYRDEYCPSYFIEVFGSQLIIKTRAHLTRSKEFYNTMRKIDAQNFTKGQKEFHSYMLSLTDILSDRTLNPTCRIEKLCNQKYPCLSVLVTQLTTQSLASKAFKYCSAHKKEDVIMMISRLCPHIINQDQIDYDAVMPPTVTTLVRDHSLETTTNSNTLFKNTISNSTQQRPQIFCKEDRQEQMKLARANILKTRLSPKDNSSQ